MHGSIELLTAASTGIILKSWTPQVSARRAVVKCVHVKLQRCDRLKWARQEARRWRRWSPRPR